jgi:hypothetical protein
MNNCKMFLLTIDKLEYLLLLYDKQATYSVCMKGLRAELPGIDGQYIYHESQHSHMWCDGVHCTWIRVGFKVISNYKLNGCMDYVNE